MKLRVELIPERAFRQNARSVLSDEVWSLIRHDAYDRAGNKCEVCGYEGELHAHEVWEWKWKNPKEGTQKLVGIKVLCPLCHEAVHLGRATVMGRGQIAKEHLREVNGWTEKKLNTYLMNVMKKHAFKSKVFKWVLDISILDRQVKEAEDAVKVISVLGEGTGDA